MVVFSSIHHRTRSSALPGWSALFFVVLVTLLFFPLANSDSHAADVILEWDSNPEPDILGYKVFYGLSSGNYSYELDVGNWTSCTISGLEPDTTYYFAAKAYSTSLLESDFSDEVRYTTPQDNLPPVADAGPDQTVQEGATVTLNGANSSDPDGAADTLSFLWTQTGGPDVTLSDPASATTTFAAPDVGPQGAVLTFELTVTDSGSHQSTDACLINITGENLPPVADAGPDQTVKEGATVTLNGTNSSDPGGGADTLSFLWTQTGGPDVTLSDPASAATTFTAPDVGAQGAVLAFELTVTDSGSLRSTDACLVNITGGNLPPVADAGPDQTVNEGTTVTLNGATSSDPDGTADSLTFLWKQTGGPAVTLSNSAAVSPTFVTPPVPAVGATLVFELTVRNKTELQVSDTVTIDIRDNGITGFPDNVITTRLSSGEPIGIETDLGCSLISLSTIDPATIPDKENNITLLLDDLIDMKIKVPAAGELTHVIFYLADPLPDDSTLYHYSRTDQLWNDYSDYTEFNHTGDQVKVFLADGGVGDDDGTADGIIVDPLAFVLVSGGDSSSPPVAESGSGSINGCFIDSTAPAGGSGPGNTLFYVIIALILPGMILMIRRHYEIES